MDKAYALYVDAKKLEGDPQSMSTSILDKPSDALMEYVRHASVSADSPFLRALGAVPLRVRVWMN